MLLKVSNILWKRYPWCKRCSVIMRLPSLKSDTLHELTEKCKRHMMGPRGRSPSKKGKLTIGKEILYNINRFEFIFRKINIRNVQLHIPCTQMIILIIYSCYAIVWRIVTWRPTPIKPQRLVANYFYSSTDNVFFFRVVVKLWTTTIIL